MGNFTTLWGDIEVKAESIIPAKTDPPASTTAATAAEVEKTEPDSADDEGVVTATKDAADVTGAKDDEEPEYEFSEEDVSKAYTMLEEQGVLDLGPDDEFENSPKGIAEAVAVTVKNKLQKEIDSIPKVVQEFYYHVAEGNSPDEFVPSDGMRWEKFSLDTEEEENAVLAELYRSQGMSDEEIQEELDDIIDPDKRTKKAEKALDVLIKTEKLLDAQAELTRVAERKAHEAAQLAEIEQVKKTIDSTKEIAGFELDDSKREAFKNYLFKVNPKSGKTQMQENMSSEQRRMTIAYLDFVNYNKADLTTEVASQLTKDRKKKLSRYTDKNIRNSNSSEVVKTATNKNSGPLTFPSIFGTQKIEIED
jgi:hypothetical protein